MPEMVADALVILKRNLIKFRRQPEMLIGYTVQPIMFVLLFVYVFGGSIDTGMDYEDFLIPGIIVQNITFGGALTAVGLVEDMKKGLIDRFRSLPMARSAVLAGPHARRRGREPVRRDHRDRRRLRRRLPLQHERAGGALRDRPAAAVRLRVQLDLRARRSVLHERRERAADRVHRDLPADLHLVRVRADRKHAGATGSVRRSEPVHHHRRCDAPSLRRHAGGQFRVGSDVVVDRSDHRVRAAGRS